MSSSSEYVWMLWNDWNQWEGQWSRRSEALEVVCRIES